MRFVCDSCRAQYMISDEKVGAKGVKVRCKKCGFVILVRKADANASAPPPPPMDEGEEGATQVLSNPLAESGLSPPAESEATNPGQTVFANGAEPERSSQNGQNGHAQDAKNFLSSVEEDEIGAVFDQVLKTGPNPIPTGAAVDAAKADLALGSEDDDRLSTRVLDSETVKKLAEESGLASPNGSNGKKNGHAVPQDWFVAIDEKQTGPLTVEKLKDLWDRGEIGPDSLCWRAGFSDWMPLSEVEELASELAPKPAKPTIVAPAAAKAQVVTVPVESAFSAGGMTKTVRSEVPMLATAPVEESGSWKPSAASALASLVKEEIDAMAKPAPRPAPAEPASATRGLLDLPGEPAVSNGSGKHAPAGTDVAMRGGGLPQPPAGMGMESFPASASYAPAYPSYAAPPPAEHRLSKGLAIGLIVAGVSVLALVGLVLFLVIGRQAPQQGSAPIAAAPALPAPAAAKPEVKMPPPPTDAKGQPLAANTPAPTTAAPAPTPTPAPALPPVATVTPAGPRESDTPRRPRVASADRAPPKGDEGETISAHKEKPSKPVPEASGSDDEFDSLFNKDKKKAADSDEPKKKKEVYVPPAPGQGADVPDSLGQAEVMQVVVSNKPAIVRCVNEQKAKDPDISGTLVMRFTVLTSGRTSAVSAQTDEFKSSHMAVCMSSLIKGWSFPRHKTQGDPINFPFKF